MANPYIKQGKVIVERDEAAKGFLLMTPDGDVVWKKTKRGAEQHARSWFKDHLESEDGFGIGIIEWR